MASTIIVTNNISVNTQAYGQQPLQQQPFQQQPFQQQPLQQQPFQQQQIVQQGVVTSAIDPLPGHEAHQSAIILRLREDNSVYSGILTFTASKPVEVQVLHRNMTTTNTNVSIPEEFGELSVLQLAAGSGAITISNIIPDFSEEDTTSFAASVPFSGNALALHNIDGEPFAAAYTANAEVVGPANRSDNIASAPVSPTQDVQDQEEEEQED
jgi:hypothetical protein